MVLFSDETIAAYLAEHPPRGRPSVVLWWDT